MINITQICQTLQQTFGQKADEIAKTTQFVQRQSKLSGSKFLRILVTGFLEKPDASLNYLAQVASDYEVEISKQGIQKRLTQASVNFMKEMFKHIKETLVNQTVIPLELLSQFEAVQLMDSTTIKLPDNMTDAYASCGNGSGKHTAGMKIQALWDFLCGNLTNIWLEPSRQADQSFKKHMPYITPGGLFLADLGYFALKSLQQIMGQNAYFISRFNPQTAVFNQQGDRIELLTLLANNTMPLLDLKVFVGSRVKLPCRLLIVSLPDKVVVQRRRKLKKRIKRGKGRSASTTMLTWQSWNLYITNVPSCQLTLQQVVRIYTLRWQIELLFKLWKSEMLLDRIAACKPERILCEIYAKLIGFLLFNYLTTPVRYHNDRELSPTKAWQLFRRHVTRFSFSFDSPSQFYRHLKQLYRSWSRHALKDKRKKRPSTCRLLELAVMPKLLSEPTSSDDSINESPPSSLSSGLFWSLMLYVSFGIQLDSLPSSA